jgi:hypothetical protein
MLNPLLLWFLPLAMVPLILHLIVRRRVKTVELPTIRFLLGQSAQQRRKLWLIEVLVMILRTLAVAMLVLMVSRPVVDRFGFLFGGGSGQDVSIIVDGGAAMGIGSGGTTSLERGKTAIRAVLDRLDSADYVRVIRATSRPEVVATGFARQKEPLQAAVDAIQTTAAGSDLSKAIELALSGDARGPRTLYVITDRRRQAWSGTEAARALADARPSPRVVVLDVAPDELPANAGVIGDPPQDVRPVVGLPVQLTATLANSSATEPRDTVLTLMLDDKQVAQESVSIPPGQRITRTITTTPTRAGVIRGRFTLPPDAFPEDDAYLFCLNVEPKVVVFVVSSHRRSDETWSTRFVTAALRAPLTAQRGLAVTARDIAEALELREMSPNELQRDRLHEADVIILDNANLNDDQVRDLRRFVEAGGGLMVLPGDQIDVGRYRQRLLSDTGIALGDPVGDPDEEARFAPIIDRDLAHPVLRVFDVPGRSSESNYFATVRLFRHFPLSSEEDRGAARLLMLPDAKAALMEASVGRGRMLVASFASDPKWSNLPLKPEFVPLMLRSVSHLRRPPRAAIASQPQPGLPLVVTIGDQWTDVTVQASDPTGRPTTLDVTRTGDQLMAALPGTQRRGYYQFEVTARPVGGKGDPLNTQLGAAINIDPRALDLSPADEATIRAALGPVEPLFVSGAPGESTIGERLAERRETWRWLVWVMFAVVGIEFMLATLLPARDPARGDGLHHPRGAFGRLADRGIGALRRAGLLESVRGLDR